MSSTSPRILFAGPMLGCHPGWVTSPAEELAPRLEKRGFACSLVSNKLNKYHRMAGILKTIWDKREEVDIVCLQVYSGPSFVVEDSASLLARRLGLPIVMSLHGGSLPDFIKRFPGWARRVFGRAKFIVTPSEYLARAIQTLRFRPRIIPNAIDICDYPFVHRLSPKPNLLWMRTFHEVYNPLMAVESFRLVKQVYPQARLTMAGQDKGMLEAVKHRVQNLGLAESVRFAGFLNRDSKQREFALHDIFLNTNRVDNMPVSVIEASAFGMPIVATSVGGVPFLIRSGENGLLVRNEDEKAMASAIQRLVGEPALAGHLSENARIFAEAHDWSVVVPKWDSLLMEVMEGVA
jgi:L-malate glycosyltransferase